MIRRKRRSHFRRLVLPLMLVAALVFSTVVSVGFAAWQDELTIETDVAVKGKPLTFSLSQYEPHSVNASSLSDEDEPVNWVSFLSVGEYSWFGFAWKASTVAYSIPVNIDNEQLKVTIYNPELPTQSFTGSNSNGVKEKDNGITTTAGGYYSWNNNANIGTSSIAFQWDGAALNALDDSDSESSQSWFGFAGDTVLFNRANVPIAVTINNPNTWDVQITSCTFSTTGIASLSRSVPFTIRNGESVEVRINPSIYTDFTVTFTDDSNQTYVVNVDFESDYDSDINITSGASAYSARPSTTTTTTTTATTTTTEATDVADETTTAVETEPTSVESAETTTTTTVAEPSEIPEETTAAETTTTTAAAETTTTTTAATTAAPTTVAPTTAATTAAAQAAPVEEVPAE